MRKLGHAGEFRKYGIAVNSRRPRTAIAAAALQMIPGADLNLWRKPGTKHFIPDCFVD